MNEFVAEEAKTEIDPLSNINVRLNIPSVTFGGQLCYDWGVCAHEGTQYRRLLVYTDFAEPCTDFYKLIEEHICPLYRPGDVLIVCEKLLAVCQNRIVAADKVKVGLLARLLYRLESATSIGVRYGEPLKLQLVMDMYGTGKVLWATLCGGIAKLFGKRGVFFEIMGYEVTGIDGFYSTSYIPFYRDHAILLPENTDHICAQIEEKYGIRTAVVDCNDYGNEILNDLAETDAALVKQLCAGNPFGQDVEFTPFMLAQKLPTAPDAEKDNKELKGENS